MSPSAKHTLVSRHPLQGCGGVVHQRTFSLLVQSDAGKVTAAGLQEYVRGCSRQGELSGRKSVWKQNNGGGPNQAAPAVVQLLLAGDVVVQRDAVPAVVNVGD